MNTTTNRDDVAYREQCLRAAELLLLIRDEWQDGDDLHTQWAAKGWSTIGDSFRYAQREARREVERLLKKLGRDTGLGIGRQLPSGCSERLFTLAAKLRPEGLTPEGELRCMLRWNDLGVDDEVEALVFMLAAQGESAPAKAASQTGSGGDAKKPKAAECNTFDVHLTENEGRIVDALYKSHPELIQKLHIYDRIDRGRKACDPAFKSLKEQGYIDTPRGVKNGVGLTAKGEVLAASRKQTSNNP